MDIMKRIDPELRPQIEMMPANARPDWSDMPKARELSNEMFGQIAAMMPDVESVSVEEMTVLGPEGAPEVKIKIYKPKNAENQLPGFFWIHGGGYIMGDLKIDDYGLKKTSEATGSIVVAVDYRLAPENPYPDGLEDCYAVLKWMVDNHDNLGLDKTRVAIGGGSAGGGLAAALALLVRDRKEIDIIYQVLIYPMLDCRSVTPSSHAIDDPRTWDREKNILAWKMYLGELAGKDVIPSYASPALESDLSGLPPAYVSVGDLDLFLDEDIDYAQRLLQAGVPTELHVYPGATHGFDGSDMTKIGKRAIDDKHQALIRAFAR